jgi:hypothetical protein
VRNVLAVATRAIGVVVEEGRVLGGGHLPRPVPVRLVRHAHAANQNPASPSVRCNLVTARFFGDAYFEGAKAGKKGLAACQQGREKHYKSLGVFSRFTTKANPLCVIESNDIKLRPPIDPRRKNRWRSWRISCPASFLTFTAESRKSDPTSAARHMAAVLSLMRIGFLVSSWPGRVGPIIY